MECATFVKSIYWTRYLNAVRLSIYFMGSGQFSVFSAGDGLVLYVVMVGVDLFHVSSLGQERLI